MPRNTRTGNVMEDMLTNSLKQGSYDFKKGAKVGTRLGGGKHMVDIVVYENNEVYKLEKYF